jgi:hypothetical protein
MCHAIASPSRSGSDARIRFSALKKKGFSVFYHTIQVLNSQSYSKFKSLLIIANKSLHN